MTSFDEHAAQSDSWFLNNENLLLSEVRLVAHFMKECGKTLSVGCGSGLFEMILKKDFDVAIENGIEPSPGMAEIARKRDLTVTEATAEEADFGENEWDTILFNGTPSYIKDLHKAFSKAFRALKSGGKIV